MKPRPGWQRGFTLFELLVTIVIIGIVISLAVLSVGDQRAEQMRQFQRQFTALLGLARETALFNGAELGISFWREGFVFFRLEDQRWLLVDNDNEMRARSFPEDSIVTVYLDGLKVELPEEAPTPPTEDEEQEEAIDDEADSSKTGNRQKFQPQVFILSSGEITPFELRLDDGSAAQTMISVDPLGRIEIRREE